MSEQEQKIFCCLNCRQGDEDCKTEQGTSCPSDFVDINSGNCRTVLEDYCSCFDEKSINIKYPDDPSKQCWRALICNLFGDCEQGYAHLNKVQNQNKCNLPLTVPYEFSSFSWSSNLVTNILENYRKIGYSIGSNINSTRYNPFQEKFYKRICCSFPALCQSALAKNCSVIETPQLEEDNMSRWCGCHLRPQIYTDFSQEYALSPPCTSYCNIDDVIPITDAEGQAILCDQSSCILTNDTINIINSTSNNTDINIRNICGSCGTGGVCTCIVDGNDITLLNSAIENSSININNVCGNFICQVKNETGVGPDFIPVPCNIKSSNAENIQEAYSKENYKISIVNVLYFLLILFVFLALILVFIYFITS